MPTTVLLFEQIALVERRRCIGLLLAEIGRERLAGRRDIADALDAVVTRIEHGDPILTAVAS